MPRRPLPDAVVPRTRDWERTTFGPFGRRTIKAIAEALFTDPDAPPDPGADARFDWLTDDVDALVSNGSGQLRLAFRATLTIVELFPLVVIGRARRCSSLPLAERARYLAKVEAGTLLRLSMLVVLWKTLLTIVYFEHPGASPHLGYDGRHERYLGLGKKRAPTAAAAPTAATVSAVPGIPAPRPDAESAP